MGWLERMTRDRPRTKDFRINYLEDGFMPADAFLYGSGLPRTVYPYARDIRSGLESNVVMAPVLWIARNFTEAVPVVQRRRDGVWEVAEDHELERRLDAPNPFYDGDLLIKASLISYLLDGNAYWQKVRNVYGMVIGYWYLPHFQVEPRWPDDGSVFIDRYEYTPHAGRGPITLPPRDVVHLRYGLDPRNPRKGMSSLRPLLREVFTDEEAANFSATILRNMGIPGGIIAPSDPMALPSPTEVEEMKEYMATKFTGDRRGNWLVLGKPSEATPFGFNPQNLMLGQLRDIAEERVCALLGIPAAVVGFGAGLQSTKVGATMRELRRLAWVSCVIPQQKSIAKQVTRQTMPDFQSQARRFRVWFDTSDVSAFQEEETEKARRIVTYVEKGVLRVDKAQEIAGLEVDPSQDVYLRPKGTVAVKVGDDGVVEQEPPPAPAPPSSNGGRPGINPEAEETVNRAAVALATLKAAAATEGEGEDADTEDG